MSDKELKKMSPFDVFAANAETLEDARKKNASENSAKRLSIFRMDKEGKNKIRILPNAPIQKADGTWELPRPGYEHPAKELLLKIASGETSNGKPKFQYVNVRHLKHIFPQLDKDLIDLFVEIACEKYAAKADLVKTIRSNSFSGGLKYDSKRYILMLDLNHRDKGIQMLSLSYSQYKELEERKLDIWEEECETNPDAPCPISSPLDAYPVEITRKNENGKTSYIFNINTRRKVELTEDELTKLLETPRVPDMIYRYTRYHLEATICYLEQYEEKKNIEVLSDPRIADLVSQIKTLLPADDTSHFNPDGGKSAAGDNSTGGKDTIDSLWETYNQLEANGLGDRSEEGQNLRNSIVEFINDNELDVAYGRTVTNRMLLERIDAALETPSDNEDEDNQAAEDDEEASQPEKQSDKDFDDDGDDDDDAPAGSPRTTRNDDTNEPAVRPVRRVNRPIRHHN